MRINIKEEGDKLQAQVAHDVEYPINMKPAAKKDFMDKLDKQRVHSLGLLPPAVRWISQDKSTVVFERPPIENMLVEFLPYERLIIDEKRDYRARGEFCSYEIGIPWTVYVCTFSRNYLPTIVKTFFRNSPLTSLQDSLYLAPLLNFYSNSKLCNPATAIFEGEPKSLSEGINLAYNMVWNSGWNFDLKDAQDLSRRAGMPFNKYELAEFGFKKTPYTEAENRAMGESAWATGIIPFFKLWASLPLENLLNRQWAQPAISVKGTQARNYKVIDAVNTTINEAREEGFFQNRSFLVDLTSALM